MYNFFKTQKFDVWKPKGHGAKQNCPLAVTLGLIAMLPCSGEYRGRCHIQSFWQAGSQRKLTLQPTNSSKGRFQSSDLKPPATSTQENPILPCKQSSYPSGKTSWKERLTQPGSICSLASPAASKPESSSHSNWVCSWLQLPRNPKLSGTTQSRPARNTELWVHNLFWVTRVAGNLSYSHL